MTTDKGRDALVIVGLLLVLSAAWGWVWWLLR